MRTPKHRQPYRATASSSVLSCATTGSSVGRCCGSPAQQARMRLQYASSPGMLAAPAPGSASKGGSSGRTPASTARRICREGRMWAGGASHGRYTVVGTLYSTI